MGRHRNIRTVIVTGLSGSGKTTALRALEDIGFFAVDNLPVALLPPFLELRTEGSTEVAKVALVMDLRAPDFLPNYAAAFAELEAKGFHLEIVYLEASAEALVRRFSQTRRTHPLTEGGGGTIQEAVDNEREALKGLRERADLVVDTSNLSVHQLKTRLIETFSTTLGRSRMRITVLSFGFKYGVPVEADLVFDARFLPNPYFNEELRPRNGLDAEVRDFINRNGELDDFGKRLLDLLNYLIPRYEKEGKAYLTVGLGCTGGMHRSVAMVEMLGRSLAESGSPLEIRHRDIKLDTERL